MTPATLAGLSGHMDQLIYAERKGVNLPLLRLLIARAEVMKRQGDESWERTLKLAQDIQSGTCPDCFGVGRHDRGVYFCGCE